MARTCPRAIMRNGAASYLATRPAGRIPYGKSVRLVRKFRTESGSLGPVPSVRKFRTESRPATVRKFRTELVCHSLGPSKRSRVAQQLERQRKLEEPVRARPLLPSEGLRWLERGLMRVGITYALPCGVSDDAEERDTERRRK